MSPSLEPNRKDGREVVLSFCGDLLLLLDVPVVNDQELIQV